MSHIRVFKTPDLLLRSLADSIVQQAKEAVEGEDRFNIALSGGSSPKKLYELLTTAPYREAIEWSKVYFFFGDERYVPFDHPDSNYLMAKKALFDPLGIQAAQIFPIDTRLTPAEAATAYEGAITNHFKTQTPRFDTMLLGMGDDAHTASLFPGTAVLHESKRLVQSHFVEKVKMERITFTAPLINLSHQVDFLVYGASKAPALKNVIEGDQNIDAFPAQVVKLPAGNVYWYLDEAAAADLAKK